MRAYLQLEELWDTIQAPSTGTLCMDPKKVMQAHAKLTLSVDPSIYPHIDDAITPKDAWDNLKKAYDDSGLMRQVCLFREISTTRLDECESMDAYVNKIISIQQQLYKTGIKLPTVQVGALLLTGLPDRYQPMIMAMEASGSAITADLVKTKLLQELPPRVGAKSRSEEKGFFAQPHSAANRRRC